MKHFFLNSYFDAIEKDIADDVDFDRMINSPTQKGAFEVLQDTNYAKWALNSGSLDEIFENEKIFFAKELERLGEPDLVSLFSLRGNIVNLRIYLKKELFDLQDGEYLSWAKDENQLLQEFKKEIEIAKNKETPASLDDYLTDVYLDKLESYSEKDPAIKKLIADYRKIIDNFSKKERMQEIKKLEKDFISEYSKINEGLAPILAFFMKKWIVEKKIRAIITGKKINFEPLKIRQLLEDLQSL